MRVSPVGRILPDTKIIGLEHIQRLIGDSTLSVPRPVDPFVMNDNGNPVRCKVNIQLDAIRILTHGELKCGKGVLRRLRG